MLSKHQKTTCLRSDVNGAAKSQKHTQSVSPSESSWLNFADVIKFLKHVKCRVIFQITQNFAFCIPPQISLRSFSPSRSCIFTTALTVLVEAKLSLDSSFILSVWRSGRSSTHVLYLSYHFMTCFELWCALCASRSEVGIILNFLQAFGSVELLWPLQNWISFKPSWSFRPNIPKGLEAETRTSSYFHAKLIWKNHRQKHKTKRDHSDTSSEGECKV